MKQFTRRLTLHRITWVLLLVALAILAFYFVVYVAFAVNLIQFPYDYDQGEGFELVDAMMFSEFRWPYQNIETYPFYGSIYPPFYHIVLVPFAWIFGPVYWYGRMFSFLTTLVTAATIGYAIYREGNRTATARFIGLLAGLAFLSSNMVYHIGPLFRQHISMVMFETLAVVILARADRPRQLALGLGLLILGGYTKQLAAFTAIAALVYLFIRSPRRGVVWGAGFVVVGGAIFLFLTAATGGHWWTQTITANVKEFDLSQATGLLRLFWSLHGALIIPAVLLVLYELYFDRISIYSLWFVSVTVFNAYAAGTWGAGDSYYATAVAATCVLSGIFATRTLKGTWTFSDNYIRRLIPLRLPSLILIVPLLYIAYGVAVLHLPTEEPGFEIVADVFNIEPNAQNSFYDSAGRLTGGYANIGHFLTEADVAAGDAIVEQIRAIPADVPVLSEEAAFSFATDRDVITNPVVLYILDQVGQYDSSELVTMIENREFGLIVLRAQFFPVPVNQAITANYVEAEAIEMNGFAYRILRPAG